MSNFPRTHATVMLRAEEGQQKMRVSGLRGPVDRREKRGGKEMLR